MHIFTRHARIIAVLLFLGILLAVFQFTGLREHFTLAFVREQFELHPAIGLAVFISLFALGNLIQIPGWIFLAAAVLSLGRTMGGLATYAAASVSCVVTFLAIRFVGGDALRQIDNATAQKILSKLDAMPVRSVALLRTLFQTMPALNAALALSGVKFRDYLLGTLLGLPLPIFLYCVFFDYVAKFLPIR